MAPDIMMDRIVIPFISAFIRIYATNTIHRMMMKAICVCDKGFLAIVKIVFARDKGKKKGTDSHLYLHKDP